MILSLGLVLVSCGARTELKVAADAAHDASDQALDVPMPRRIADAVEVSVYIAHACLRREDGQIWCWGGSSSGRLGNSCEFQRSDDEAIPTPTGVELTASSVSVGTAHTCALQDDGVWCWGGSTEGQLMAIDRIMRCPERLAIERPRSVLAVSGGGCVISEEGLLSCWGQGEHGELGAGANNEPVVDATPIPLTNVAQVSVSADHGCARTSDGVIYCWGSNEFAQVGEPPGPDEFTPRRVEGLPLATDVVAGHEHSCAIADGDVWCWGANYRGALALGDRSSQSGPVRTLVRGAGTLARHGGSCAIHLDGRVSCWGTSSSGVLLAGREEVGPVTIPLPGRAVSVDAVTTACAVLEDGSVWCWGGGSRGQLGNSSFDPISVVPVPVVGFP